jgi:hypothetical protein
MVCADAQCIQGRPHHKGRPHHNCMRGRGRFWGEAGGSACCAGWRSRAADKNLFSPSSSCQRRHCQPGNANAAAGLQLPTRVCIVLTELATNQLPIKTYNHDLTCRLMSCCAGNTSRRLLSLEGGTRTSIQTCKQAHNVTCSNEPASLASCR